MVNGWKAASIVLILVLTTIAAVDIIKDNKMVNLGDVKISQTNYESISNLAEKQNWDKFVIVDMETGNKTILGGIGQ